MANGATRYAIDDPLGADALGPVPLKGRTDPL
jgi:hypothetical protein